MLRVRKHTLIAASFSATQASVLVRHEHTSSGWMKQEVCRRVESIACISALEITAIDHTGPKAAPKGPAARDQDGS